MSKSIIRELDRCEKTCRTHLELQPSGLASIPTETVPTRKLLMLAEFGLRSSGLAQLFSNKIFFLLQGKKNPVKRGKAYSENAQGGQE